MLFYILLTNSLTNSLTKPVFWRLQQISLHQLLKTGVDIFRDYKNAPVSRKINESCLAITLFLFVIFQCAEFQCMFFTYEMQGTCRSMNLGCHMMHTSRYHGNHQRFTQQHMYHIPYLRLKGKLVLIFSTHTKPCGHIFGCNSGRRMKKLTTFVSCSYHDNSQNIHTVSHPQNFR